MEKVATLSELKKKAPLVKWVGKKEVVLVLREGKPISFSGMCPHQGGPLSEGDLTTNTVTCPWHGCTFELKEGRCTEIGTCRASHEMKLEMIPLECRGEDIYVALEKV